MSSHSGLDGRDSENNSADASPTRPIGSPRLNLLVGIGEGNNGGHNLMPTLYSWETDNIESGDDNHGGAQTHAHADATGGDRSAHSTPSFLATEGQAHGRNGDDCLQETGYEGADGDEHFETDEYDWRGKHHVPHQRRGRPRFAGDGNEQGHGDERNEADRHNNGFMSRGGMASYSTQHDDDQTQQPLETGAARDDGVDGNGNGENAPSRGNDGNNFGHHNGFHTSTAEQHQAPSLNNGSDFRGDNHHGDVSSGRNVGEDSTTPSSMHYEHPGTRPSAGSLAESVTDHGGDNGSLRESRIREVETSHRGSSDDIEDDKEEDGDGTEGQAQKRSRQRRQDYYQRLVGDGFRTIAGFYVTTNRAIRGVEAKQKNMLDVENEIGEDLIKFGAHIREATQLMQAQITAAFTGEEVAIPQAAIFPIGSSHKHPEQAIQVAECSKTGPTKASVHGRNNALEDSTTTITEGLSNRHGTLRTNGNPPGLMSRPRTATAMAAAPMPAEAVGRSRHFDASRSTEDPHSFTGSNTSHSTSYSSVSDNDGHTDVPDEHQQDESVAQLTDHSGEHSAMEGEYGGRVAPPLSEKESRGGLKSGGSAGGGVSTVKRPRWNSSLSDGDSGSGAGEGIPPSLFRGPQEGSSLATTYRSHAEVHGRWSRE